MDYYSKYLDLSRQYLALRSALRACKSPSKAIRIEDKLEKVSVRIDAILPKLTDSQLIEAGYDPEDVHL